ncbi:MAG: protein kinase [Acidobacteriota bacterium]
MIGKKISHYKILEKIGEGGMGEVYLAEDTKLDRKVALKFLPPALTRDEEAKARFQREAKAAATLNHPNIVTIYEINEHEDQTYIAMEYVDGQTLKELVAGDRGPSDSQLPIAEVINYAIQICEGLKCAHEAGIVHRDIKPQNIIVTNDGKVKILDFGLAKLRVGAKGNLPSITKLGTTMGTINYMSPEQASGEKVDQRTDIWSLGVVLYEMLTSQLPFKGEYEQAIMYNIINEEPEPLTGLRTGVPMGLEKIINKVLSKKPEERYQGTADLLVDLKTFIRKMTSGEQISYLKDKQPKPSIAALPFANISADPEQEYFCDGMTEEIINSLTHLKDLRIVARTSSFAFKGKEEDIRNIGKKLNVEHILEGSVRKAGKRLRITAQLIKVSDGYHIWSEKFDRERDDIFAIQDEIALAIVDSLKVKLLGKEKEKLKKRYTEDQEAYHLYLKGTFHLNKHSVDGSKKALECFQKAVEKDHQFALAYVGVANSYGTLGILSFLPPGEFLLKAKEALNRALEIDDSLSDAHGARAFLAFFFEWNWAESENRFKKALHLNSGDTRARGQFAWFMLAMGRFENAIKEIKKAQELDPLMPLYYTWAIPIYGYAGKFPESIEQFHKAIELDPNMGLAYFHAGCTYFSQKKYNDAMNSFQKAKELSTGSGWAELGLGITHVKKGNTDKARQILNQILLQEKNQYISPFTIALLLIALGEKDNSLKWFEKAYKEHDILMTLANVMFGLEEARKEPRFQAIMKKMKLIK